MKNKKLLVRSNIWLYVIPFLGLIFVFSIGMYSAVERRIHENYEKFKIDAINAAREYSNNLKRSVDAGRIIDHLLDEKLTIAGNAVTMFNGQFSQRTVKALVKSLNVDQICIYNKDGVIIYSNVEEYIGWKAEEGHPVKTFMESGRDMLFDEIRADSVSGEYYKYAYYRFLSGGFVQIGIFAEDINKISGKFDIGKLLDDIAKDPGINQISLIDINQVVVDSSNHELQGVRIDIPEAAASIKEGKEISFIDKTGKEVLYKSIIPFYNDGVLTGAVFISSRELGAGYIAAQELKRRFWATLIGILVISGAMLMLYRNGSNYIKLAYYDASTGLPNQESLKYFMENLFRHKRWNGALMMLNFSLLSNISLLYGSDYTEKVFSEITKKVERCFYNYEGITFRMPRDRLVIFIETIASGTPLSLALDRVKKLFETETFTDQNIYMPVEIGAAELSEEDDPKNILKKVLIALSRVKVSQNVSYQYFNSEMEAAVEREGLIEKEILKTIKDEDDGKEGSLYVLFQPQIETSTGKITGFETLSRMKSDKLGAISPVEFIEIAERKILISPLTELILKKALLFIKMLKDGGHAEGIRVAVNISGMDLMRSDFLKDITDLIEEYGIEKNTLEFEITESIFIDEFITINKKLGILRSMGIHVSIDDFGTGYSSFSRLRELNVDTVKIDKQFVDNILIKKTEELMLSDIISMAHKIGLSVVAEGVETETQRKYLAEAACDTIQGYFFSRPVEASQALDMLSGN
ncbi:MAG: GGDEF domain-containing phosphodiesterase [Synergistaceae bacterium]|nr:GGDEF domain-containing phosphodiesterase [Synergistaceae bacterium]